MGRGARTQCSFGAFAAGCVYVCACVLYVCVFVRVLPGRDRRQPSPPPPPYTSLSPQAPTPVILTSSLVRRACSRSPQVLVEFVKRCPVPALHMTPALADALTGAGVSAYRRREALGMLLSLWRSRVPVARQHSATVLAALNTFLGSVVSNLGAFLRLPAAGRLRGPGLCPRVGVSVCDGRWPSLPPPPLCTLCCPLGRPTPPPVCRVCAAWLVPACAQVCCGNRCVFTEAGTPPPLDAKAQREVLQLCQLVIHVR